MLLFPTRPFPAGARRNQSLLKITSCSGPKVSWSALISTEPKLTCYFQCPFLFCSINYFLLFIQCKKRRPWKGGWEGVCICVYFEIFIHQAGINSLWTTHFYMSFQDTPCTQSLNHDMDFRDRLSTDLRAFLSSFGHSCRCWWNNLKGFFFLEDWKAEIKNKI